MPKRSGRKRGSVAYNPIDVHVGGRLRTRRTLVGVSQMALGDAIGLAFQQLQKYETGANRISASRLYDLSQVLDIGIAYFFDGMDQATQKASPAQISRWKSMPSPKKPNGSENSWHRRETLKLVRAYYSIADPTIRDHLRKLAQSIAPASSSSS